MRIAAIDIGTNSIHMIVVQVRPDLSFEVIDREKEMVRLGAGGLDGRALTPTAMTNALQALSKFKRIADSHRVDEIIAAATSAVREAENGGDFLSEVERQTGVRARVITGREEARLIHIAACYGIDVGTARAVSIDIGGGSVEITLGTAKSIELAASFKIGVIRLSERFVKSDPLAAGDERRLVRHISRQIGAYVAQIVKRGYVRVIGSSGTILSLGALAASEDRQIRSDDLRNRRVSAKALHRLRKRLTGLDLQARLKIPGLDPRRADLAVAGSILLDTVLSRLRADDIVLCDLALREGLVIDYVRTNQARIAQVDRIPDVRRRSVIELAERCNSWTAHAQHVARLALALYDQTSAEHGLGAREREWLEYAALLHDIGTHISYDRHHLHSYYLIKNGDLRGFEPEEVEVLALAARYHRRGTPKKSHDDYGALSRPLRRAVKTLAAIVRLAEGLDRSHSQVVDGLRIEKRPDDFLVQLRPGGDAELEMWAAHRHVEPLQDLLGSPLRFEIDSGAYADQSDNGARVSRQAVRRRGHRRLGQDHAARPARQVAGGRRSPGGRDGVELVGARQGRDQDRQEEERADAHDVQPAARDGLRRPAAVQDRPAVEGGHDRARRPVRVHGVRARRGPRRRSGLGQGSL
jgi:exopolyphosphatase/guanosine-5'-triphosphate,3'-diphosphate pyrophosphatase